MMKIRWFALAFLFFSAAIGGIAEETIGCNFENLSPSTNLCDKWSEDDATNVHYEVTDDHVAKGIPVASPTGDHFLYIHHEGETGELGMLQLALTVQGVFTSNMTLTFDYFLKTTRPPSSSGTRMSMHYSDDYILIAFVKESTTDHWDHWSSNVVVTTTPTSQIEMFIDIAIEENDVIAMDNIKLIESNAVWIADSTTMTIENTESRTSENAEPVTGTTKYPNTVTVKLQNCYCQCKGATFG